MGHRAPCPYDRLTLIYIAGMAAAVTPSPALLAELAPLAPVAGCAPLVAHQADDVFELWRRWEVERGGRCTVPFWAVVWPGARMIARWLLAHEEIVRGKRVLDLGCGGAAAGIAAMLAGARALVANDVDPAALRVARLNAAANHVALESSSLNLVAGAPPAVDVVLVADMFYERSVSDAALAFLTRARAAGCTVLIADAGRPFAPREGVEVLATDTLPVNRDLEGVAEREVRLLALG